MKLTPKTVGDALEVILGYRAPMNPLGFDLVTDDLVPRRARIQRGSGIAGHGDIWALVRLPDGSPFTTGIETKAQLTRAVLEFMAGPRPGPLTDYTAPRAKRVVHPRTGVSRFVWYRRRRAARRVRVALVPFGAAHR